MNFNKQLKLNKEAIPYILLQRTELQKIQSSSILKIFAKFPFNKKPYFIRKKQIESFVRYKDIEKQYSNLIFDEYHTMIPFLPSQASAVLDIGCGIAGIDYYIWNHYNQTVNILLLDKTQLDNEVYFLFHDKAAYYNSLQLAREILNINGINDNNIFLHEANDHNTIEIKEKLDLVISLKSWGFHYPLKTYTGELRKITTPETIIITDVRKTDSEQLTLKNEFIEVKIINENKNSFRLAAKLKF